MRGWPVSRPRIAEVLSNEEAGPPTQIAQLDRTDQPVEFCRRRLKREAVSERADWTIVIILGRRVERPFGCEFPIAAAGRCGLADPLEVAGCARQESDRNRLSAEVDVAKLAHLSFEVIPWLRNS